MRIALVHSFYRSTVPSGENVAVEAQYNSLSAAGHEVRLVLRRSDELSGAPTYALASAIRVATGRGKSPSQELASFAPDIVHVHNLFPNWAENWLCHWEGPLVATLHNYRPLCLAGTLYRKGGPCTECLTKPFAGLVHGCYRDSRLASLPLAIRGRGGAVGDRLLRRADRIIVLSERARMLYESAGIAAERMSVIPNFASARSDHLGGVTAGGARWLYAGRLSEEKGVEALLAAWPIDRELDVVGDGPLAEPLRRAYGRNIRFLGLVEHNTLLESLPGYTGLVFPSACFEGAAPLVYLEALAAGIPVLASGGNSVADDILLNGTGQIVSAGEWAQGIEGVTRARAELSARCRSVYKARYAEHAWLAKIVAIYSELKSTRVSPLVGGVS